MRLILWEMKQVLYFTRLTSLSYLLFSFQQTIIFLLHYKSCPAIGACYDII
nr:MAG TPA: hypothetical protein [Caudoviricetes sp.]